MHEPQIANSAQPIAPRKYPTSFKLKPFSTNLIQIKFHCYFFKVYKVKVIKQRIFFV